MTFLRRIDGFFFRPISTLGFGLMRAAWGLTALFYYLLQWRDTTLYYSIAGLLPPEIVREETRSIYRFSLLDTITAPDAVFTLYLLLLLCLLCAAIGLLPRLMIIASCMLMFSFHEQNPFVLGGGDTVLRLLGFLLCIAPDIRAFSLDRAFAQWRHFRQHRALLPAARMPIWTWRLLLWQYVVIYGYSMWEKLLGALWLNGAAVTTVLHHPIFARGPQWLIAAVNPFSALITWLAILYQALWILLLIPEPVHGLLPRFLRRPHLLRLLLLGGVLFHGSIFVLMDAGSFSVALFCGYLGLLLDCDFEDFRTLLHPRQTVVTLYDGRCRFCMWCIFFLRLCDWLHVLQPIDLHDADARAKADVHIPHTALIDALHIVIRREDGSQLVLRGFLACRAIALRIPLLWPLVPILFFPGMPAPGEAVYRWVAGRRMCTRERC